MKKFDITLSILAIAFMFAFFYSYAKWQELKDENKNLKEKIEVLDSYPYEHSEIKKQNNDRVTDFPKHNDFGNCPKYRQCSCTCSNGERATEKTTKESSNLRDSRGVSF